MAAVELCWPLSSRSQRVVEEELRAELTGRERPDATLALLFSRCHVTVASELDGHMLQRVVVNRVSENS